MLKTINIVMLAIFSLLVCCALIALSLPPNELPTIPEAVTSLDITSTPKERVPMRQGAFVITMSENIDRDWKQVQSLIQSVTLGTMRSLEGVSFTSPLTGDFALSIPMNNDLVVQTQYSTKTNQLRFILPSQMFRIGGELSKRMRWWLLRLIT